MSRDPVRSLVAALLLALLADGLPAQAHGGGVDDGRVAERPAVRNAAYGEPALLFVENRGQVAEGVGYYLPGSERTIWLTEEGIGVTVRERSSAARPAGDEGLASLAAFAGHALRSRPVEAST